MKIKLYSILVDDQDKALKFYTEVLGFVKKTEIPMDDVKWLTIVSPEEPEGTEVGLEPDYNPALKGAVKTFKKTLVEQGIPFTAFEVEDIQKEYERLKGLGVKFTGEPQKMEGVNIAVFDDTCGNLIQIYELT